MSIASPTIALRNISLLPFSYEDVDAQYHGSLQNEDVIRYLEVARRDRSMPALQSFVAVAIEKPNFQYFKIVDCRGNGKIGTISLNVDPGHGVASFGYLIGDILQEMQ